MTTTRVMPGIEDLTGKSRGSLRIEKLISRLPVRWAVRCEFPGCGLSTIVDHQKLQNGVVTDCPNRANHQRSNRARTPGPVATVATIPTGVRSRDSASSRQFQREQRAVLERRYSEPVGIPPDADPDILRRYLDSKGR